MTVYTAAIASYFFDILLRFRIGDVGLVADIKQVILKIEIDEGYRGSDEKVICNKIYFHSNISIAQTEQNYCHICMLMMLQQVLVLWKKV